MNTEYIHLLFERSKNQSEGYSSFFFKQSDPNQANEIIGHYVKLFEVNKESNQLIVEYEKADNEMISQFNQMAKEVKHLIKVPSLKIQIKNFNSGKSLINGSYNLIFDFLGYFSHCLEKLELDMGILFSNQEELSQFYQIIEKMQKINSFSVQLKNQEKSQKVIQYLADAIALKANYWQKLTFNFEQTSLDSKNLRQICSSIQQCRNLNTLNLNLYYNKIDESTGQDLSLILEQAKNLESIYLDISDNLIGKGILPFVESIQNHKSLKNLKIFSRSNFIRENLKQLLVAINQNTSLINVYLNMRNNYSNEFVFSENDLRKNTNLITLDIQICEFNSVRVQRQLFKLFKSFENIQLIQFYGNILLSADSLSVSQLFDVLFNANYLTNFQISCNRLFNNLENRVFMPEYIRLKKVALYQMTMFTKYITPSLNFSPIQTFYDIWFDN